MKSKITLSLILGTTILSTNANATAFNRAGSRQQLAHKPNVNRENLTLRVDPNKIQFKDNTIYIGDVRADNLQEAIIEEVKRTGLIAAPLNLNSSDIEFKADGMFVKAKLWVQNGQCCG